jgi:glucose/arabinose dehydrogenase
MRRATVMVFAVAAALIGCGDSEKKPAPAADPTKGLPKVDEPPVQAPKSGFAPEGGAEGVTLEKLGTYVGATGIAFPPGETERFVVIEKKGRLLWGGKGGKRPFLDLRDRVSVLGYEQGLLGIAFAPDYRSSHRVYVAYTDREDKLAVEEYLVERDRADPASRRPVFRSEHPTAPGKRVDGNEDPRVHNGGQLAFGPDGHLYIGLGDGGPQNDPRNQAQSLDTSLGKILRIDPLRPSGNLGYEIPADNPFAGQEGKRGEIWAYGLRNPFRFSFDRESGDLSIGDVGGNLAEEIDYMAAGEKGVNFGWRCWEGNVHLNPCEAKDHRPPLIARPGSKLVKQVVSIIGGYVVRDPKLPALNGRYLYSEFYSGELRSTRVENGKAVDDKRFPIAVAPIASFGEDADGRIYTVSLFTGEIHRFVAAG